MRAALLFAALRFLPAAALSPSVDDTTVLMQRVVEDERIVNSEEWPKPLEEQLQKMQGRITQQAEKIVDKMVAGVSKGVAKQHANLERRIGKLPELAEHENATTLVGKINQAVDEMKLGMHDLARGVNAGMNMASEKIAAQIAQSVQEHVREELALQTHTQPASLLQVEQTQPVESLEGVDAEAIRAMRETERDIAKDAAETAALKGDTRVNRRMKKMMAKFNRAMDDMRGNMHDMATGITLGMKEASERIAAQMAQTVHEHVRQEIELARASEPAS